MAMGSTGSGGDYNAVYFLDAKSPQDKEKSIFKTVKALGEKQYEDMDDMSWVSGIVDNIEIIQKEWEGDKYDVMRIKLIDDPNTLYVVNIRVNMAIGREFVNRLLSVKHFEKEFKITLYTTEPGEGYDHGWKHISLKVDGESIPPKHFDDVIGQMYREYEPKPGKKARDWTEQSVFLLDDLRETTLLSWEAFKAGSLDQGLPESDDPKITSGKDTGLQKRVDKTPEDNADDEKGDLPF